jgi:small subunit ribosomal protein S5
MPRLSRKPKSEYDQKMVDIARVARVVAGGRRFRFRATVVLGNRKGKVSVGLAKGKDVSGAVEKASMLARKHMVQVPMIGDTIPHQIQVSYGGAEVLLKPARPGTGIIAGGAIRPVIELSGIKNIISKMLGSSNKVNNVRATIKALSQLSTPDELAERRGVTVRGTFQRKPQKTDKQEPVQPELK